VKNCDVREATRERREVDGVRSGRLPVGAVDGFEPDPIVNFTRATGLEDAVNDLKGFRGEARSSWPVRL